MPQIPRPTNRNEIQPILGQCHQTRTTHPEDIQEAKLDTVQENQGDTDASLEQLSQQWIQAKINTEHHCRKLNTRKIPWTPSLTLAIYKVLYWKGLQK